MHFESRKHLLEYDDVANEQRKTIYRYRNELLDENYDIRAKISQNIAEYSANVMNDYMLDESGSNVMENLKAKFCMNVQLRLVKKILRI